MYDKLKKTSYKKQFAILLLAITTLYACNTVDQLTGMYNMTRCKYEYRSISGLTIAGINLQNSSGSALNPLTLAKLISVFSSPSGSLPLTCTLNVNVINPNAQAALMNGLNYILEIDGTKLTQGVLDRAIHVEAGGQTVMPVYLAFDLRQTLNGKSLDAVKNLAFNLAGTGDRPSNITFHLKPSFNIAGKTVTAPNYIPVSFTLNRK
jgi:hypothetical protein